MIILFSSEIPHCVKNAEESLVGFHILMGTGT